ncbi:hypothetical protein P4H94_18040 [Paenibacillus macerans]|uniref:hypothetical protein n=1 Tax=Paenibacillus macerans TaxID=44252 RepID=UPI000FD74752|nr:hypothetical protein [Paenibacillus macerans]MCY7557210.1 hypothetical protein [Paenibacillus macerans]MEC0138755.1 hypothetical protein [Paenibacillus macerans]MEC0151029.1 hypothetical protein [Paenibacillus macerans]
MAQPDAARGNPEPAQPGVSRPNGLPDAARRCVAEPGVARATWRSPAQPGATRPNPGCPKQPDNAWGNLAQPGAPDAIGAA